MFRFDKKPYLKEVKQSVDAQTGEIVSQEFIAVEDEADYALIYCRIAAVFKDLRSSDVMVMALLMCRMNWNNEAFYITIDLKREMAEYMKVSVGSVSNAISRLLKEGILVHDTTRSAKSCRYMFHPQYIYKGSLTERRKKLKYVLELSLHNKG